MSDDLKSALRSWKQLSMISIARVACPMFGLMSCSWVILWYLTFSTCGSSSIGMLLVEDNLEVSSGCVAECEPNFDVWAKSTCDVDLCTNLARSGRDCARFGDLWVWGRLGNDWTMLPLM